MSNRVLVAGLIAGVAFFLLGWLVYGMALRSTMEANTMAGLGKSEAEFNWAFLVIGNLALGFLIAYVVSKANAASFAGGATVGAIVGFLFSLAVDGTMYATSNYFTSTTGLFMDVIAATVMCAIVGGIVGWWYSRGRAVAVA